jgi:Recombination endonuclease VII
MTEMVKVCKIEGCVNVIKPNRKEWICSNHRYLKSKYGSYDAIMVDPFPEGIIRICEKHGPLTQDMILKKKGYESKQCKLCSKESNKKYYETKGKLNAEKKPEDWGLRKVVKTCAKHGNIGPKDAFFINSNNISCRLCRLEASRRASIKRKNKMAVDEEYRESELKRHRELKRKYQAENPEKIRKARREYHKKNPEKVKKWRLKEYGVTLNQYTQMLIDQNYCCKICKKPETALKKGTSEVKRLAVDHCHASESKGIKKPRGLLCQKCNCMIGFAEDSCDRLLEAVNYLRSYDASPE